MTGPYEHHAVTWRGIPLQVRWSPHWFESPSTGYAIAHLEITAQGKTPLPITETGYKSHFIPREAVEAYGGPAAFVLAWLDHEAASTDWRPPELERQLSLF